MTIIVSPKLDETWDAEKYARHFAEHHQDFVSLEDYSTSYECADGGALNLTIRAGVAHICGKRVESDADQTKTLTDAATNYVFLDKDGTITINTTGTAPSNSIKLAEVVTSGGAISSITDTRPLDPTAHSDVLISGSGASRTRLSDWRHAGDLSKIDHADVYQPYAEDVWLKKSTPALRQQGTETGAKDYRIVEDTGKWKLQHNTGTEAAPVWETIVETDLNGNLVLVGDLDISNSVLLTTSIELKDRAVSHLMIRNRSSDAQTFLNIIPNAPTTHTQLAGICLYETDRISDPSNFAYLQIFSMVNDATFGTGYVFRSLAAGTGKLRPISFFALRSDTGEWHKVFSIVTDTSGENPYVDNSWKGIKNVLLRSSMNANKQMISEFLPWIAKTTVWLYEHFLGQSLDSNKWATGGTGTFTILDEVGGVLRMQTPASEESEIIYTKEQFNTTKNVQTQSRWRLSHTDDISYQHVLNKSDWSQFIRIWFKRVNLTNYSDCHNQDAVSYTKTTFSWTFDTNWHRAKIVCSSNEIKFYVDDSLKATHTTNIPTVNLQTCLYIHTYEAVAKYLDLDYVETLQEV